MRLEINVGRRAVALVTAVVMAMPVVAAAAPPHTEAPGESGTVVDRSGDGLIPTTRYSGVSRYDTAGLIAREHFAGASAVVLARADLFPDALAANRLAGALDAPVLLTPTSTLSETTRQAITEIGPSSVFIAGSTNAVSQAVEDDLAATYEVTRVGGDDRYETAAMLAEFSGVAGRVDGIRTAVIASGLDFPDALIGGPAAYSGDLPLLLTRPDSLPQVTRAALADRGIGRVVVIGGPATIDESVIVEVESLGIVVERVFGDDRTATSAAMARWGVEHLGWSLELITVARGDDFPDALTLGPRAGIIGAPILLTRTATDVGPAISPFLAGSACEVSHIDVAGGPAALAIDVEQTIRAAGTATVDTCRVMGEEQQSRRFTGTSNTVVADVTDGAGAPARDRSVRFEVYRDTDDDQRYALVRTGTDLTGDDRDADGASTSETTGQATIRYAGPTTAAAEVIVVCELDGPTCGIASDTAQTTNFRRAAAGETLALRRSGEGGCDTSDFDLLDCMDVAWEIDPSVDVDIVALSPQEQGLTVEADGAESTTVVSQLTRNGSAVSGADLRWEVWRDADADGLFDRIAAGVSTTGADGSFPIDVDQPATDAVDVVVACLPEDGATDCGLGDPVDPDPTGGDNNELTRSCDTTDGDAADCADITWIVAAPAIPVLELMPDDTTSDLEGASTAAHTVTATLRDGDGAAQPSTELRVEIWRDTSDGSGEPGHDLVSSTTVTTDGAGSADITVAPPAGPARDVIVACLASDAATSGSCEVAEPDADPATGGDSVLDREACGDPTVTVDCVDHTWRLASGVLLLTPQDTAVSYGAGTTGSTAITADLTDSTGAAAPEVIVRFEVWRDRDADGSYDLVELQFEETDVAGQASITLTGPADIDASDVVVACVADDLSATSVTTPCGVGDEPPGDPETGDDSALDRAGTCDETDLDASDCADVTWTVVANTSAPETLTIAPKEAFLPSGDGSTPLHALALDVRDDQDRPVDAAEVRWEQWRDTNEDALLTLIASGTTTTTTDGTATLEVTGPDGLDADDVIAVCITSDASCGLDAAGTPAPGAPAGETQELSCDDEVAADDLDDCAVVFWEIPVPTTLLLTPKNAVQASTGDQPTRATLADQFGTPIDGADVRFEIYRSLDDGTTFTGPVSTHVDTTGDATDADGAAAAVSPGVAHVVLPGPELNALDVVVACADGPDAATTCATLLAGQVTRDLADTDPYDETTITWTTVSGGEGLVGAVKHSIRPRPEDYVDEFPDAEWQTEDCIVFDESAVASFGANPDHAASASSAWPSSPNCLYMGGFGIGPSNAITGWDDEFGLWVRAFAARDAEGGTAVMIVLDGTSYLGEYANKCETAKRDCGAVAIGAAIADRHGISSDAVMMATTHSHASPDFIGGWGFVPDWYMAQVNDTIHEAVDEAIATMRPATIEVGEELARPLNRERRETYWSAEEQQITWLRAQTIPQGPEPAETIATIGAFAGHPTSKGTNGGVAHADWVGAFEARLEERFGGVGMHFMTGLGNFNGLGMGNAVPLADTIPAIGDGTALDDTTVVAQSWTWGQPVTNAPLTTLGTPGFFDRKFDPSASQVAPGKERDSAPCPSSSNTTVRTRVNAMRIGSLVITGAPGEIFSNLSNTVKERSGALVTMPLAQVNDGLGYIMQSVEHSRQSAQGAGFAGGDIPYTNYEDAYALDACFGDQVLDSTLSLIRDNMQPPASQPTPTSVDNDAFGGWSQTELKVLDRLDWRIGAPGATLEVGAAKTSIEPQPSDPFIQAAHPGATWQTENCLTLDETFFGNAASSPNHLASSHSSWPSSPSCIYQGGFGIGPMNPVERWDTEFGLFVRSVAIRDEAGDLMVMTILDGTSFMGAYGSKRCAEPVLGDAPIPFPPPTPGSEFVRVDCGAHLIASSMAAELGAEPSSFLMASSHSHAAPDFIGGWGFVPDWYMTQVHLAIKDTIRDAVADLQPAYLEVGEEAARFGNTDRRDTYWSAEDQQIAWFRAVALDADLATSPRTIATVGSYSAHPTAYGNGHRANQVQDNPDGLNTAHPDWVGDFEGQLESRFGGVGLHFMGGLGNQSQSDGAGAMPARLVSILPPVGHGTLITDTDVTSAISEWRQPSTNLPLTGLGIPGFFDRQFDPIPAAVQAGKRQSKAEVPDEPELPVEPGSECRSASPYSVQVQAIMQRVGPLVITGGPGELFANLTNTVKDRSARVGNTVTMPLSQVNDGLGYIMQEFEFGRESQQGAGFGAGGIGVVDYEDSYAIDACFGDKVLQETLELVGALEGPLFDFPDFPDFPGGGVLP